MLRRELQSQPIFLAIDNICDTTKSVDQAKMFLEGGFAKGSVIIMTARSLDVLGHPYLGIDDDNCLEMPELNEEEAKSLFVKHAIFDEKMSSKVDVETICKCLKRCYFDKGDGKSYHYHPLALKVLGMQLGCSEYDKSKWEAMLEEGDTFNLQKEGEHPIFSIFRKSYSLLTRDDQMLFMDVVFFLPSRDIDSRFFGNWWEKDCVVEDLPFGKRTMKMTSFEWLSMVHSTSVKDIMERVRFLMALYLRCRKGNVDVRFCFF